MPVETQIVHYPEREKYVVGQGRYIQGGYTGSHVHGSHIHTGSHVHTHTAPTTTTYTTQTVPTTVAYQTYQSTVPTQAAYQVASSTYGTTTGNNLAYQTYQNTVPSQAAYQIASSGVRGGSAVGGQSFTSGAVGTGSNYVYTSGGPLETSTYTTGGYAQPLSVGGYVTKDGTHLSNTGNIVSSSQVKNNTSYATNV